ncbi:MAG: hypothetical protein AAF549_07930 [Pseudomonadota bacterium]
MKRLARATAVTALVSTVAGFLGGNGADAQEIPTTRFNERSGITSCELGPDGPQMTKDGEQIYLPHALVTETQILASDGSVGATRICDRTDRKDNFVATTDVTEADSYVGLNFGCVVPRGDNQGQVFARNPEASHPVTITAEFKTEAPEIFANDENVVGACDAEFEHNGQTFEGRVPAYAFVQRGI